MTEQLYRVRYRMYFPSGTIITNVSGLATAVPYVVAMELVALRRENDLESGCNSDLWLEPV